MTPASLPEDVFLRFASGTSTPFDLHRVGLAVSEFTHPQDALDFLTSLCGTAEPDPCLIDYVERPGADRVFRWHALCLLFYRRVAAEFAAQGLPVPDELDAAFFRVRELFRAELHHLLPVELSHLADLYVGYIADGDDQKRYHVEGWLDAVTSTTAATAGLPSTA